MSTCGRVDGQPHEGIQQDLLERVSNHVRSMPALTQFDNTVVEGITEFAAAIFSGRPNHSPTLEPLVIHERVRLYVEKRIIKFESLKTGPTEEQRQQLNEWRKALSGLSTEDEKLLSEQLTTLILSEFGKAVESKYLMSNLLFLTDQINGMGLQKCLELRTKINDLLNDPCLDPESRELSAKYAREAFTKLFLQLDKKIQYAILNEPLRSLLKKLGVDPEIYHRKQDEIRATVTNQFYILQTTSSTAIASTSKYAESIWNCIELGVDFNQMLFVHYIVEHWSEDHAYEFIKWLFTFECLPKNIGEKDNNGKTVFDLIDEKSFNRILDLFSAHAVKVDLSIWQSYFERELNKCSYSIELMDKVVQRAIDMRIGVDFSQLKISSMKGSNQTSLLEWVADKIIQKPAEVSRNLLEKILDRIKPNEENQQQLDNGLRKTLANDNHNIAEPVLDPLIGKFFEKNASIVSFAQEAAAKVVIYLNYPHKRDLVALLIPKIVQAENADNTWCFLDFAIEQKELELIRLLCEAGASRVTLIDKWRALLVNKFMHASETGGSCSKIREELARMKAYLDQLTNTPLAIKMSELLFGKGSSPLLMLTIVRIGYDDPDIKAALEYMLGKTDIGYKENGEQINLAFKNAYTAYLKRDLMGRSPHKKTALVVLDVLKNYINEENPPAEYHAYMEEVAYAGLAQEAIAFATTFQQRLLLLTRAEAEKMLIDICKNFNKITTGQRQPRHLGTFHSTRDTGNTCLQLALETLKEKRNVVQIGNGTSEVIAVLFAYHEFLNISFSEMDEALCQLVAGRFNQITDQALSVLPPQIMGKLLTNPHPSESLPLVKSLLQGKSKKGETQYTGKTLMNLAQDNDDIFMQKLLEKHLQSCQPEKPAPPSRKSSDVAAQANPPIAVGPFGDHEAERPAGDDDSTFSIASGVFSIQGHVTESS